MRCRLCDRVVKPGHPIESIKDDRLCRTYLIITEKLIYHGPVVIRV